MDSTRLIIGACNFAYQLADNRNFWDNAKTYVDEHSYDRRYKLHVLASSSSTTRPSAIVKYRNIRYHVYYNPVTDGYLAVKEYN